MAAPARRPSFSAATQVTGSTDTAVSPAWATSRVMGDGAIRKNGAIRATIGEKWSPSRLNPVPRTSATGACRWAYCLTCSVKMPRSQEDGLSWRYRNSDRAR